MINQLNVLAVIPARGGSKGVQLKNLREVGGVPIVQLAAQIAISVDYIDRIIVSTDHEGIAESAIKGGADAIFRRPKELSGDYISDVQVLTHAILEVEKQDNVTYDVVVMLQPTSPLRTKQHVIDAIEMLVENDLDSVWTLSETDSKCHPLKQLTVKDGIFDYCDTKGKGIIARQELPPVYHRNGIAYAIKRETLISGQSISGKKSGALICTGDFVSIDTEFDFLLAELIHSTLMHN